MPRRIATAARSRATARSARALRRLLERCVNSRCGLEPRGLTRLACCGSGGMAKTRQTKVNTQSHKACHSSWVIPACRNSRANKPLLISPRCGFGRITFKSSFSMNSCLPPALGPTKPSCRRPRIRSDRLIGAKVAMSLSSQATMQ